MAGPLHRAQRRNPMQNDALVLRLLRGAATPVSAYDIAKMAEASGVSLVPNQVYRTMARLLDRGQVRRIETLNAYLQSNSAVDLALVCVRCRGVELVSLPSLPPSLAEIIADQGFHPTSFAMELLGRCFGCRQVEGTPASGLTPDER